MRMAIMMAPMSPTCLAKPSTNPFSVVVLVSAEEFANIESNVAPICCARDPSAIFTMYQPTCPCAHGAVFVQVVVAEEELRLVDAGLGVVHPDDVEFPDLALLGLPDGALDRDAIADLPAEPFGQVDADDRALTIARARPSSGPAAACTPGRAS